MGSRKERENGRERGSWGREGGAKGGNLAVGMHLPPSGCLAAPM